MIETALELIVNFVKDLGYVGIFIMTLLESTFLPIPAEITMVPAGYLVHQGEMNFIITLFVSILGTVAGALVNYWLSERYGRPFLLRYGKFFMVDAHKIDQVEGYFREHGPISIFTGRLIPGLRHFISIPAGMARMDLKKFCIYTALGGGIWMFILLVLGYAIGDNQALLKHYLLPIKVGILVTSALGIWYYIRRFRKKALLKRSVHEQIIENPAPGQE